MFSGPFHSVGSDRMCLCRVVNCKLKQCDRKFAPKIGKKEVRTFSTKCRNSSWQYRKLSHKIRCLLSQLHWDLCHLWWYSVRRRRFDEEITILKSCCHFTNCAKNRNRVDALNSMHFNCALMSLDVIIPMPTKTATMMWTKIGYSCKQHVPSPFSLFSSH